MKKPARKTKPDSRKIIKSSDTFQPFWWKNLIPVVLLFFLAFGLYLQTKNYLYALDDKLVITDNQFTNLGLKGIWKLLSKESFTGYFGEQEDLVAGARYRPLSLVTFAIEREFFEEPIDFGYGVKTSVQTGKPAVSGNPHISHLINALLYSFCALVIFRVLCLMFSSQGQRAWYISVPFLAALLYVVHPLHTEAVANIKGRDEILAMLFSMSSLYFFLKNVGNDKVQLVAYGLVSYFLALLAKENALTMVLIIPLTLHFFSTLSFKKALKSGISLVAVTVLYFIIRWGVIGNIFQNQPITDLMNNPFTGMSIDQKVATILYTLGFYVKLLFIPHPLTHDYYPYKIAMMSFGNWQVWVSILLFTGLVVLAWRGFRNRSVLSYSILFFIITLSLASNILLPVGTFMNERFLFMPSLGFCIALAYFGLEFLPTVAKTNTSKVRNVSLLILLLTCAVFSLLVLKRNPAWRSNYELNSADIITSAQSARANLYMGLELFNRGNSTSEITQRMYLFDSTESYVRRALSIYPMYGSALQMLGALAAERFNNDGNIDKLLSAFKMVVLDKENTSEVDRFLSWLNRQNIYDEKLFAFYHDVGYETFFKQRNNVLKAEKYIRMGLEIDAENPALKADLQEIMKK
jgi:hypothetical protein